jgi:hypothetical protein
MAGPNHRQKREPPNARKAKRVSDSTQRKKQGLTLVWPLSKLAETSVSLIIPSPGYVITQFKQAVDRKRASPTTACGRFFVTDNRLGITPRLMVRGVGS